MRNLLTIVLLTLGMSLPSACGTAVRAQDTAVIAIPACIQEKIEEIKNAPVANPPITIYQYSYNGEKVYHISAPCCDRYSTLYNVECEVVCHPDGGITGKGDGKCTDFYEKSINKILIWKDNRTQK